MSEIMQNLSLNKTNYDRRKVSITVNETDFTKYVTAIDYSKEQPVEFNYNLLGQVASYGKGNISCSGTLTLTDGGVNELNKLAKALKLPDYLSLGESLETTITVSYTTFDGLQVKTDTLYGVFFTSYNKGNEGTTAVYERAIPFGFIDLLIG